MSKEIIVEFLTEEELQERIQSIEDKLKGIGFYNIRVPLTQDLIETIFKTN